MTEQTGEFDTLTIDLIKSAVSEVMLPELENLTKKIKELEEYQKSATPVSDVILPELEKLAKKIKELEEYQRSATPVSDAILPELQNLAEKIKGLEESQKSAASASAEPEYVFKGLKKGKTSSFDEWYEDFSAGIDARLRRLEEVPVEMYSEGTTNLDTTTKFVVRDGIVKYKGD